MNTIERRPVWMATAVLVLSGGLLCFAFTRKDPWEDAHGIMGTVIAALCALVFLAYALLPTTTHAWVTRMFVGLGAMAATACTIMFGSVLWVHRATLGDLSGPFGFIALVFAISLGVSLLAWWALLRQFRNPQTGRPHGETEEVSKEIGRPL